MRPVPRLLGLLALLGTLAVRGQATADDVALGTPSTRQPAIKIDPSQIRRVPADQSVNWPAGDWQPVARSILDQYLEEQLLPKSAVLHPRQHLRSVRYTGSFDDGVLRGTCEFQVPSKLSAGEEIELYPLSMRWHDFRWSDSPAFWGTRVDGVTVLQRQADEFSGSAAWEVAGQRVFDTWEFDLLMPTAGTSEFVLNLPVGMELQTSGGVVEGPKAASALDVRRWVVHAGRRTQLKLTCGTQSSAVVTSPTLIRESHIATLQSEGVDLASDFEFVAGDIPVELQFELPPELQILSATAGADTRVPFQVRSEGATRIMRVQWTSAVREPRLRLRGFGIVRWNPQATVPLPLPRLVDSVMIDRELAVHVLPPLQLQSFRADGYRLTDRRTDAELTESWAFQGLQSDPQLGVRVSTPQPVLTAQIATWADFRTDIGSIRSRLHIQGSGGPTFEIDVDCPTDWDVVKVGATDGTSASVSGFYVAGRPTSPFKTVTIELAQPLLPGDTVDLLIDAVTSVPRFGRLWTAPTLQLTGDVKRDGILAILHPIDAELTSSIPSLESPPSDERLRWLESLAAGQPISDAHLFDLQPIPITVTTGVFSLEATSIERDPMADPRVSDVASADTSPLNRVRPEFAELRLSTRLAAAGTAEHRHIAQYFVRHRFHGPVSFGLSAQCSHVELAVDGKDIPLVSAAGEWQTTQAVTAARELTIAYRTPAASGLLTRREEVDLPDWKSTSPPLDWKITPALSRACGSVAIPFAGITDRNSLTWTDRCFGPLARKAAPTRTPESNLSSSSGESTTFTSGDVHRALGILRVHAAETPARLDFASWDPDIADRTAWAVLMLSLFLGVWLRRVRWRLGRSLIPLALLTLLLTTWSAPDSWVRMSGGALTGLVLTILLPRRVVMPSAGRRLVTSDSETRIKVQIPLNALVLLCLAALHGVERGWSQDLPSGIAERAALEASSAALPIEVILPELDGEPTATAYVSPRLLGAIQNWKSQRVSIARWIIRAAEYDVAIDTNAEITGRFEVLVRGGLEQVPIRLAIAGVTFDSVDAVTVDGNPGTIIPTTQGAAIIVNIPPDASAPSNAGDDDMWIPHVIEVHCRSAVEQRGTTRSVGFQIPMVSSTVVRWSASELILNNLRIEGATSSIAQRPGLLLETRLGERRSVQAVWEAGETPQTSVEASEASPSIAVTELDVAPLRSSAHTWMELPLESDSSELRWSILLRPGVAVRRIESPAELRWQLHVSQSGPVLKFMSTQSLLQPPVIMVETVAPADPAQIPDQDMPLTGILQRTEEQSEIVSLRIPVGFESTVTRNGIPAIPVADLTVLLPASLSERLSAGNSSTYRLQGPGDSSLRMVPMPTTRHVTADSRLSIGRSEARWSSAIVIDVTGSPTPIHQFRVDPGLQIERITALQDGADRLARFVRRADRIELILTRPYSGPLRVQFSGTVPVIGEVPLPIPRTEVIDGTLQSSIYQVVNDSGWTSEITRTSSESSTLPSSAAGIVFTDVDPDPPLRFRLLPGADAVAADVFVQFTPSGRSGWQQRAVLNFRPQGVPLKTLQIRIPPKMQSGLRVFPPGDVQQTETTTDGWRTLTLHPSRLRGGTYRLQLQAPLTVPSTADVWEYLPPEVVSAQTRSQALLIPERFPLRPTSATGVPVPGDDWPEPWGGVRMTEQNELFDIVPDVSPWTMTPNQQDSDQLSVPLSETIVWVDAQSGLRGTTVLTAISRRSGQLELQFPASVEVLRVSVGGLPGEWSFTAGRLRIETPDKLSDELVSIDWKSEKTLQAGDAIPLPKPIGWSPGEHLVALIPSTSSGLALSASTDPIDLLSRRMSALLTAAEQQSSRTFTLDSPLLESLRRTNGDLERHLQTEAATMRQREACEQLRARSSRVHKLIAVEASLPGDNQDEANGQRAGDPWNSLALEAGIRTTALDEGREVLRVQSTDTRLRQPLWGALVVIVAGIVWLVQRAGRWELFADWLADRPALAGLLLGAFWVAFLQPRIIGVLLLLVAMAWLGRTRKRSIERADTALIGPGR